MESHELNAALNRLSAWLPSLESLPLPKQSLRLAMVDLVDGQKVFLRRLQELAQDVACLERGEAQQQEQRR